MEMLSRGPDVTARERELMKAVLEQELVTGMMGMVQVSMPGMMAAKAAQRKSSKEGK